MEIEINGIKYHKREISTPKISKGLSKVALMAMAFGGYDNNSYQRKRPNVNIVEEFKLIQLKQSKLCRDDRDWVVHTFNKLYKQI